MGHSSSCTAGCRSLLFGCPSFRTRGSEKKTYDTMETAKRERDTSSPQSSTVPNGMMLG